MIKKLSAFAMLFCAAMFVAACANVPPPQRPVPVFDYAKYPQIKLDVASVQINEYIPTMQAGHVEHLMPMPLPQAASQWARTRFKAVGEKGTAFITVKEASVVEVGLNRSTGVRAVFTVDQAERYDAALIVEIRIEGREPEPNGNGIVKVERSQTIAENASLQARDKVWTDMEEKMMSDLDAATLNMISKRLSFVQVK